MTNRKRKDKRKKQREKRDGWKEKKKDRETESEIIELIYKYIYLNVEIWLIHIQNLFSRTQCFMLSALFSEITYIIYIYRERRRKKGERD